MLFCISSIDEKYVEFVTVVLIVLQQLSVGFNSGEYGGKNSTLMFPFKLLKYFRIVEDLW